jgi:riboflavin synthase
MAVNDAAAEFNTSAGARAPLQGSRPLAIMAHMFTGLVEEMGIVDELRRGGNARRGSALRLVIKAPLTAKDTQVGDSIAVNGCCLTVVEKNGNRLAFDAGSETLSRTNFDRLQKGEPVNLERSLVLGDRLGGHLVTGHIDGPGTVIKRRDEGDWSHFTFRANPRLMRQMASKGSIAVDGVSLTLVAVESDRFSVALIPHTLTHTTLGQLQVGSVVNLETDLLAKYVERQLESRSNLQGT